MDKISYFNRIKGCVEEEKVYGERWIQWLYGNGSGKIFLPWVSRSPWVSALYGWWMRQGWTRSKIDRFIDQYGIERGDYVEPEGGWPHFDAFFCRSLREGARSLDLNEDAVGLPADGRHRLIRVDEQGSMEVKGKPWDLESFLGFRPREACWVMISRLCPVDYHGFHFGWAGRWEEPVEISGKLLSVSPLAEASRPSLWWENRRWLCECQRKNGLKAWMLPVGATCVGSIEWVRGGGSASGGELMGKFHFGGSAVVSVLPASSIEVDPDVLALSAKGMEFYDRVGSVWARFVS